MLSLSQLCQECQISKPTYYRLLKESKDFLSIVEQHSIKRGNKTLFDTPVKEWLLSYYGREETASTPQPAQKAPETPLSPPPPSDRELELLEQVEALQSEIDRLKRELEAKEEERKAFFIANNHLLLLLSQEKQEKQALLPPPRVPLSQRIASIFKKEKQPG